MSKLADTLSRLGQMDPARIGFGRQQSRNRTPLILLAGRSSRGKASSEIAGALDLLVFDLDDSGPPNPPDDWNGTWGVSLSHADSETLDALKEAGCQFVLIQTGEAGSVALRDDGMDRGLVVTGELTDRRARAIEDMPFEFIVIRHDGGANLSRVADVIDLQETVSLFNMHVFLEVAELPTVDALEALRDLPVSALLLDADNADARDLSQLRDAISKLEQREDRGKRVPTLPMSMDRGTVTSQPDYDGEDWGDD